MKLSTGKAQGLVVEWGGEKEEKGMSFGRVGMVGSEGLGRSGRWDTGGNSGSSSFSNFYLTYILYQKIHQYFSIHP